MNSSGDSDLDTDNKTVDECDSVESVMLVINKATKPSTVVCLLVESLLQQLCELLEPDADLSRIEYKTICDQLHAANWIDETYTMGEFDMMRSQYQKAFSQLVNIARGRDLPVVFPDLQEYWPLPAGFEWSRYCREFEELSFIAGGGFGKVFRSRNKLDDNEYAVKKVTIRSTTINNLLIYLAEVKTLANLEHVNIVTFKAAWLEPFRNPGDNSINSSSTIDEDESSSLADDEIKGTHNTTDSLRRPEYDSEELSVVFENSNDEHYQENSDEARNQISEMEEASSSAVSIEESQPHIKPKWAILYIQMTLYEMTLRDWLDKRNGAESYAHFYAQFRSSTDPTEDNLQHFDIIIDIFQQMLNGLSYIHSRGIVHHDIKPCNIFVSQSQHDSKLSIKLGDFGLACRRQCSRQEGFGTRIYAAPEQLTGQCDRSSDIYSLGIILLELLVPFSTDMERAETIEQVRCGQFPPVSTSIDHLLMDVLKLLLCKEPAKRLELDKLAAEIDNVRNNCDQVISDLRTSLSLREEEISCLQTQLDEQQRPQQKMGTKRLVKEIRIKITDNLKKMEMSCKKNEKKLKNFETKLRKFKI